MQLPFNVEHGAAQSLQDQIFHRVRRLILDGQLKPGTSMPATRELSRQLEVSRNTVLLAYDRLIAEGYLETEPAVGTFVSAHLPEDSLMLRERPARAIDRHDQPLRHRTILFHGQPHGVYTPPGQRVSIDFKVGRPDPNSFPARLWQRLLVKKLEEAGKNLTEYSDPAGLWELRKAIAGHLGPARGIATTPEQVLVVAGCQEALDIVARLFVTKGTQVVTECPCYQGAAFLFESYGADLCPIPVDNQGIQVDRLPDSPITLAYLTPSHQYPMGATLSLERRLRLLEWAAGTGAYLIEDDYDSDFRHHGSPLTALKGLDRYDSVIYLGTFSKSIGASLRLGYMVLPRPLVKPATDVKTLLNNGQPWLEQAVLAEFMSGGGFGNHLRRIRRVYLSRRDCLVSALRRHFGEVRISGLEGGMHIVWHLPAGFPPAPEVERRARDAGVAVYTLPGGAAYCQPGEEAARRAIMLGYSSLEESEIKEGVARIAAVLAIEAVGST